MVIKARLAAKRIVKTVMRNSFKTALRAEYKPMVGPDKDTAATTTVTVCMIRSTLDSLSRP